MGFMDRAKQLGGQAKKAAKQHPDQVEAGVAKAEQAADSATGHKYTDKIETAGDKAEEFLEK